MRYFRYSGPMADVSDLKQQYARLSVKEQAQQRRLKRLQRLGTVVFWLVFLATFIGLMLLIRLILPKEEGLFGAVVRILANVVLAIVALIPSAILGAVAAGPLWGQSDVRAKALRQQVLNHACRELRDFYGFQEPFLVTKCYRSSDRRFDRHDVCLFVVDGKLRLTANLHYGFFDPRRDLGCYEFDLSEISLHPGRHKDREAVELRVGETTFLLGQRAKSFIKNAQANP